MPQIGKIFLYNEFIGLLIKEEVLYKFTYDSSYLKKENPVALSVSLPLQATSFESNSLFPYFAGLLSEGWLKKIQSQTQKIDEKNLIKRLLKNGEELLGAIRIEEVQSGM